MAVADRLAHDYAALTGGCGLIDRSERGKLLLTGAQAAEFLQGQVTNDVEALAPGDGCYAAFLTPKGKMLGDLRVLRGDSDELWLDTERVALQPLFNLLRHYKVGYDVELHKRTLERGLLSLVGPRARAVAGAADLLETEHAHRHARIAAADVRLIATDAGVDVVCDSEDASGVVDALVGAGAAPVGEEAAECVRVERGRPRYGLDMDEGTIPQEAGINARAVSFVKGCYVGQETVARLHYRGKPNRHLRGLRLAGPLPAGAELRLSDRVVGRLGSVALSPRLGSIGLALVRREAEPGARLRADGDVEAEVVELPFAPG